jgi:hypothetical protein
MKKMKMPLNLQFFAEGEPEEKQEEVKETKEAEKKPEKKTDPNEEVSVQDLLVEIAKLKREKDRASAEAADYKKKFRATQSEKEIMDAEKAEAQARRDEEFEAMKREITINKLAKNYMALGYSSEMAEAAATADVDNDSETRFKIQAQVDAEKKKAWEKEFIASRPQIAAGTGGTNAEEDPFLKGFNSVKH